jgi:hypothetical protein
MMLKEFWNLYACIGPDDIAGVAENGDAESYATGILVETLMELAFES